MNLGDVKLFIPSVTNRTTGLSMGEHSEITTKRLIIGRERQDEIALNSHINYIRAKNDGFFDDMILPLDIIKQMQFLEKIQF